MTNKDNSSELLFNSHKSSRQKTTTGYKLKPEGNNYKRKQIRELIKDKCKHIQKLTFLKQLSFSQTI